MSNGAKSIRGAVGESPGTVGWQDVDAAASLARHLLGGDPARLDHSAAVAARADVLSVAVDADDWAPLVAAAWLHDLGYAPELRRTGFHPLDGARYLRSIGWNSAVCNLVAHHSGSRYLAAELGLGAELADFVYEEGPLSDALTVADQTVGPYGQALTIDQRMLDMLARHGPDSPNARAHKEREPYLRAAAHRVAARLEVVGIASDRHRITNPAASHSFCA